MRCEIHSRQPSLPSRHPAAKPTCRRPCSPSAAPLSGRRPRARTFPPVSRPSKDDRPSPVLHGARMWCTVSMGGDAGSRGRVWPNELFVHHPNNKKTTWHSDHKSCECSSTSSIKSQFVGLKDNVLLHRRKCRPWSLEYLCKVGQIPNLVATLVSPSHTVVSRLHTTDHQSYNFSTRRKTCRRHPPYTALG